MNIVVQASPLRTPLLDTREAGTVLIYDSAGQLIFFILVLPGSAGAGSFITCDLNDPQFTQTALSAGLKLNKNS